METTISDVSKTATPIALMVLGGDIVIKNISNNLKYVIIVTLGKLFVIPAIVSYVTYLFGFRGPEFGAIFSMVAPSVSISSYTMAQQYDCNYELAGQIVFISTLLSPFSIFLFIYFFKTVGLF